MNLRELVIMRAGREIVTVTWLLSMADPFRNQVTFGMGNPTPTHVSTVVELLDLVTFKS